MIGAVQSGRPGSAAAHIAVRGEKGLGKMTKEDRVIKIGLQDNERLRNSAKLEVLLKLEVRNQNLKFRLSSAMQKRKRKRYSGLVSIFG